MNHYPTYREKGASPFDPLELAKWTEAIVCRTRERKYTAFYCTGVYGGMSTGYTVGCLLRCIFCWVSPSREIPHKMGEFHTSRDVFYKLVSNAKKSRVRKLRISGGEPTLCREHLLSLLDLVERTPYLFILETNGILLGQDSSYAKALTKYSRIQVRVSLKAGTPEGFEERTGALGKYYALPFKAISNLKEGGVSFHVACMSDPKLMPQNERKELIKKLHQVGYRDWIEEEICDPYDMTLVRLKKAGWLHQVFG